MSSTIIPGKKGRFSMRHILTPTKIHPKKRKERIPIALREQVWIQRMGRIFEGKCPTPWCENQITVFDFESGHNIPESKGGSTTIDNLVPLCSRCNKSMGNRYTFESWSSQHAATKRGWLQRYFSCFHSSSSK